MFFAACTIAWVEHTQQESWWNVTKYSLYGAFLRFESGALDLISELKRDFYSLYCCSLYGLVVVWENFLIRISIIAEITIDFWLLSIDIAQNFGCKSSLFSIHSCLKLLVVNFAHLHDKLISLMQKIEQGVVFKKAFESDGHWLSKILKFKSIIK